MATGTAISDYLENQILNHFLKGGTAVAQPATLYVSLHTADPTDAGTGAEVSGGAYARQPIAFSAASAGSTKNNADITYPAATANWGTATHIGIWDALTTGNLYFYGPLASSAIINTGTTYKLPLNQITVALD
jgi:hypothetical protein